MNRKIKPTKSLRSSTSLKIRFQLSLQLIYFRYGSNTCSHCVEEWQKPIRYGTLHFQDRCAAQLRSLREITVLMCAQEPIRQNFRIGTRQLSGIVWTLTKFYYPWCSAVHASRARELEIQTEQNKPQSELKITFLYQQLLLYKITLYQLKSSNYLIIFPRYDLRTAI